MQLHVHTWLPSQNQTDAGQLREDLEPTTIHRQHRRISPCFIQIRLCNWTYPARSLLLILASFVENVFVLGILISCLLCQIILDAPFRPASWMCGCAIAVSGRVKKTSQRLMGQGTARYIMMKQELKQILPWTPVSACATGSGLESFGCIQDR